VGAAQLGIGRATALQYAHNGVKALFICDSVSTHLESLKRELLQYSPGARVHVQMFDAACGAAVEAVVQEAVERYGRLDVFFANAGIVGGMKVLGDITTEEFMHTMRVNALSVFLAVKHAAVGMRVTGPEKPVSGGSIIATASTAGVRSGAGTSMIDSPFLCPFLALTAWGSGLFCF
jgi:NAD(P)-dependent dehydrogenase (short-subunit alcohol dehydrogenase family)